jgi:predicted ATP-dependent serine protease
MARNRYEFVCGACRAHYEGYYMDCPECGRKNTGRPVRFIRVDGAGTEW